MDIETWFIGHTHLTWPDYLILVGLLVFMIGQAPLHRRGQR